MLTLRRLILSAMLAGTTSGQRLSTAGAKLVGQWEEYVIDATVQIAVQPDHRDSVGIDYAKCRFFEAPPERPDFNSSVYCLFHQKVAP